MSGKPPPLQHRRLLIASCLLAALLLIPLPASGGARWDFAAALGYVSVVFAILLYVYPLRARSGTGEPLPHRRLLSISQHRRFGWIALLLAGAHTLLLLAIEPLTVNYLRASAPVYMLCGLGALLLLAILVPTGTSARKSMRRAGTTGISGLLHALLAAVFLGLIAAHLLGSGQFLDTLPKALTACTLLAVPLLWAAVRVGASLRSRQPVRIHPPSRPSHWRAGLVIATGLLVGVTLLVLPASGTRLLAPARARTEPLPVRFPHELHTGVGCVACHHNFRDTTGMANCIDCHRSGRADLPHSSEVTFHFFCRSCHRELAMQDKRHGPTRACEPCHRR